ncbi:von Willebrand factor type A domain-containing protein [Candidatus Woesearchaeota archaeon]|nr:von Willebrand factor type A domain-containing protein [Candidatus Woesearchaeota archaeon]MCF7900594.1 von Willebrand factor type A domain-containing protein [Candidatus Woesearchaeota archaeon]MCF8013410.1 von Willebrand factor type A domain-containing protein [Candidatus Woesearchaeota archaeon]
MKIKQFVVIATAIAGTLIFALVFFGMFFLSKGTSELYMAHDMQGGNFNNLKDISNSHKTTTNNPNNIRNMYFVDYGTHVFISPKEGPYSTFALDVDTASFTIAKNYVMRGSLPPVKSIRPEEFVNYFNYEYPNPDEPFDIYSKIVKSPFDKDINYLMLGVKAREPFNTKPKKLTLVIDVSGSMLSENRLGLLKTSLKYLVNNLKDNDYVAIITYSNDAKQVLDFTSGSEKDKIMNVINNLSPQGSTNAEAGLSLGYSVAEKGFNGLNVNRVILLSDGVANVGKTSSDGILSKLGNYKDKGISLTSIGVGMGNYNDVLLEQIADKADGNYFYINDVDEGKRVFDKQLDATTEIVGEDAKIQVHFNENIVESYRLIGYENRDLSFADFQNDSVDAGEIGAGHQATAIYELKLKKLTGKVCDVSLKYKDENRKQKELSDVVYANIINFENTNDYDKLAIATSRYAQILKLTAPPPSINKVKEIVDSLNINDDSFTSFKEVVHNAKVLIDNKR